MKIFVTVGFESVPFDRLLQAIDQGLKQHRFEGEVLIQKGHSRYQVRGCESQQFLGFDEVVARLKEADIVIGHAGVGTTLLCLALGKIPILFPRQSRFHEHVDDHQMRFAQKMESEGKALVAYDEDDLFSKICRYGELVNGKRRNPAGGTPGSLGACLGRILEERAAKEADSR
jgi:UDP-N-acetylglucosamine transferase subunit ALG13